MQRDPHQQQLFDDHRWIAQRMVSGWRLPEWVRRDDISVAADEGLWRAVLNHNGDNFEAYARARIRGSIKDELRRQDWLPRGLRTELRQSGEQWFNDSFDDDYALSQEMGPEEICIRREALAPLARLVRRLPTRERYIVVEHYFMDRKFKDIAKELGVSEPRISQLHARALERMQDGLRPPKKQAGRRKQTGKR